MVAGGATMAPLAGACVRPEPRAAPSSGTSVVPFGTRAHALRGAPGGVRGVMEPVPRRRAGTVVSTTSGEPAVAQ